MSTTIRGMTGYGQGSAEADDLRAEVEVKGVNGRFLDVKLRLPAEAAGLEAALRARVQERVQRGRIDIAVVLRRRRPAAPRVEINRELMAAYLEAIETVRRDLRIRESPGIDFLAGLPGVIVLPEAEAPAEGVVAALIGRALDTALAAYEGMRAGEGRRLAVDLAERLATIADQVALIETGARAAPQQHSERLRARLQGLVGEHGLDAARLAQEAALLADRLDITEEIVRLRGYLDQATGLLRSPGGPVGKMFDFVLQEMNREANTVSSKAEALAICQAALRVKTEVEKMREQVQNLE
jgi:uncharacterized protein (TIGR00255 family)